MSDFASAFDGIKPAFRRLVEMDPFCLDEVPSPVPAAHPGVYLLSESDRPLYVGRTRDVRGRLSDHRCSAPTRATLAVKMARIAANRPATYTSGQQCNAPVQPRSDVQDPLRRGEGANLRHAGSMGRRDR